MRLTTSAFCVGEQRQQTTAGAPLVASKKRRSMRERHICSDLPSITRTLSRICRNSSSCARAARSLSTCMEKMVCARDTSLLLTAMQVAVSILSPVSIQTLMPALRSVSSVLLTCSCSLSSTPVRPISSRPRSSRSITSATSSSLPSSAVRARCSSFMKLWNSASLSTLLPNTSVRRPSRARLPHSSASQSFSSTIFCITTSAPFMSSWISPVSTDCTMMPIRLRSLVNGKHSRIV
mmetsp:Transcript_11533/g.46639  ORF Transcript_11533/g.46639 Transcript_11533/m.46639 type:complete len:236 (+) Transcript_11533:3492-4199(+)